MSDVIVNYVRIRAAMRVVQPKTEKFNDKNESAFKYAVFIRKGFLSNQIIFLAHTRKTFS